MTIVEAYPPNYPQIAAAFDIEGQDICFTYGDTLYNPSGNPVSEPLMAHEEVHMRQQADLGVDQWWSMYLVDPAFRLEQELEAYRAQYQRALETMKDRNQLHTYARRLAHDLSGPMYLGIISFEEAYKRIKK